MRAEGQGVLEVVTACPTLPLLIGYVHDKQEIERHKICRIRVPVPRVFDQNQREQTCMLSVWGSTCTQTVTSQRVLFVGVHVEVQATPCTVPVFAGFGFGQLIPAFF